MQAEALAGDQRLPEQAEAIQELPSDQCGASDQWQDTEGCHIDLEPGTATLPIRVGQPYQTESE